MFSEVVGILRVAARGLMINFFYSTSTHEITCLSLGNRVEVYLLASPRVSRLHVIVAKQHILPNQDQVIQPS